MQMRLAIIDMGTNSIRYSIYEGDSAQSSELIYKKGYGSTRKGVFSSCCWKSKHRQSDCLLPVLAERI